MRKHNPVRLTAALVLVLATLLLTSGCYTMPEGRAVKWRVREADHTVAHAQAIQLAEPVITAVADAIDDVTPASHWEELTVEATEHDDRCGLLVRKAGSFKLDLLDDSVEVQEAVANAAAPFGYTNIVTQGRGGPGTEYADVATNDTMLVVGHEAGSDATIDVYVPAHHDQCG